MLAGLQRRPGCAPSFKPSRGCNHGKHVNSRKSTRLAGPESSVRKICCSGDARTLEDGGFPSTKGHCPCRPWLLRLNSCASACLCDAFWSQELWRLQLCSSLPGLLGLFFLGPHSLYFSAILSISVKTTIGVLMGMNTGSGRCNPKPSTPQT